MKLKPIQKRLDRKMIKIIEKIQKQYTIKKNKPCSFSKASGLLAMRLNK